jgi:hypothetical protein
MDERLPDVNPATEASLLEYIPSPIVRDEHSEDTLTRLIEHQVAKVPSDVFLFAVLSSMAASLALELTGLTRWSRFVGMWPPALLAMGIYNKMVKVLRPR